jgi:ArsR family transcriptional regulator
MVVLNEKTRERVAARFRALGEPMRLKILERLFRGEASVNEILEDVGGTQANVSKHLSVLFAERLLERRKEGTRTLYAIADPMLEKICAIVCGGVQQDARREARELVPRGRPRRA